MRRNRKRYAPKKITGLTWTQKRSIEATLDYAHNMALRNDERIEVFEDEKYRLAPKFAKLLATFRKKTKHMKPPRKRRRRKNGGREL